MKSRYYLFNQREYAINCFSVGLNIFPGIVAPLDFQKIRIVSDPENISRYPISYFPADY